MNSKTKIQQQNPTPRWREIFSRHRRMHDPMLVFNMSMFNFAAGWNRIFNQLKVYKNDT